jgi:hypothetical protein
MPFSYTQYTYRGDQYVMSPDEYRALCPLDSLQLETFIQGIRDARWRQFREHHHTLLWGTGIAFGSGFLAIVFPPIGIIMVLTCLCPLGLGISALSRAFALRRECRFLRRCHKIARASSNYEDFREAYSRKIANC